MHGFVFSIEELVNWYDDVFWVFTRIAAMFAIAPIIGSRLIPVRIRIVTAFSISLVVLVTLPPIPQYELFSYQGLLIMLNQILIGISMGFIVQLVFNAVTLGGEVIAMTMGLGFAQMVDPQSGIQVPVVSQFYVVTSTLLFLAYDGHIILISMIAQSFISLPIQPLGIPAGFVWHLLEWASNLFIGAILLSMPIITGLLITNVTMGVMTRSAPQLNIFAVGFPLTMLIGFILILLTLPAFAPGFAEMLEKSYALIKELLRMQ